MDVMERQRGKTFTEKRRKSRPGMLAFLYLLGSLRLLPQPCNPPCPPSTQGNPPPPHTHICTGQALPSVSPETGWQPGSAHAELMVLLGCLEMIQGHPCRSQRKHWLLKPDRGVEGLLLYFYTFISLHFQQAGTAHLQNHLGKQKDGNFH